jgi:Uma2 family endonuclease
MSKYGGASRIAGNYVSGPLEFVAEVCRSSASYDLHQKLELYEAVGVPEYLAVLLYEQEIRWHVLEEGAYRLLARDADKIWRSRIFPGL